MKALLALLLVCSASLVHAIETETPSIMTTIDENNTIILTVNSNDSVDSVCHYSVSWLSNILTYRKEFGDFNLAASGSAVISFKNDKWAHITRLHTKVTCE